MRMNHVFENDGVSLRNERLGRLGILHEPAGYVDGGNRYQYVKGNPINGLDPTGLQRGPTFRTPWMYFNWDWGHKYGVGGVYSKDGLTYNEAGQLYNSIWMYTWFTPLGSVIYQDHWYNDIYLRHYISNTGEELKYPYSVVAWQPDIHKANDRAYIELKNKNEYVTGAQLTGDSTFTLGGVAIFYKKNADGTISARIHDKYDFHPDPARHEKKVGVPFPIIPLNDLGRSGWMGGNTIKDVWMASLEDHGFAKSFYTTIEWVLPKCPVADEPVPTWKLMMRF